MRNHSVGSRSCLGVSNSTSNNSGTLYGQGRILLLQQAGYLVYLELLYPDSGLREASNQVRRVHWKPDRGRIRRSCRSSSLDFQVTTPLKSLDPRDIPYRLSEYVYLISYVGKLDEGQ